MPAAAASVSASDYTPAPPPVTQPPATTRQTSTLSSVAEDTQTSQGSDTEHQYTLLLVMALTVVVIVLVLLTACFVYIVRNKRNTHVPVRLRDSQPVGSEEGQLLSAASASTSFIQKPLVQSETQESRLSDIESSSELLAVPSTSRARAEASTRRVSKRRSRSISTSDQKYVQVDSSDGRGQQPTDVLLGHRDPQAESEQNIVSLKHKFSRSVSTDTQRRSDVHIFPPQFISRPTSTSDLRQSEGHSISSRKDASTSTLEPLHKDASTITLETRHPKPNVTQTTTVGTSTGVQTAHTHQARTETGNEAKISLQPPVSTVHKHKKSAVETPPTPPLDDTELSKPLSISSDKNTAPAAEASAAAAKPPKRKAKSKVRRPRNEPQFDFDMYSLELEPEDKEPLDKVRQRRYLREHQQQHQQQQHAPLPEEQAQPVQPAPPGHDAGSGEPRAEAVADVPQYNVLEALSSIRIRAPAGDTKHKGVLIVII